MAKSNPPASINIILIVVSILRQVRGLRFFSPEMGHRGDREDQYGADGRDLQDIQGTHGTTQLPLDLGVCLQRELDVGDVKLITDQDGQIKMEDFIEFSLNASLVDLTSSPRRTSSSHRGKLSDISVHKKKTVRNKLNLSCCKLNMSLD